MVDVRYRAPGLWLSALEVRAPAEYGALLATLPLQTRLPRGDGHPVVVIPGFMAPDVSTAPMRALLRVLGYRVHGWGQGFNLGPRVDKVAAVRHRILDLAGDTSTGVSLVGWSLGGMYARLFAKDHPDAVRTVVTLASPFRMGPRDRTRASSLYEALERDGERRSWQEGRTRPMLAPSTSLFTKLDGVVDWRACLSDGEPQSESIEVRGGSHFGLGHNPVALAAVADRLAQPPGGWRPYRVPAHLRPWLAVRGATP